MSHDAVVVFLTVLSMTAIFIFTLTCFLMCFLIGFWFASEDAKARLTGKKPVDDYWRKRGMK